MGTKEVTDKTESEVQSYLNEIEFQNYDYSFLLSKSKFNLLGDKNHVLDLWKYERDGQQSTIQVRIYDAEGDFVNGYAQCYGDLKKVNIFAKKELVKFKQFPNNQDLTFKNELELMSISEEVRHQILATNEKKKYTFVIYWNIWSNYYSKIIFRKLDQFLEKYNMRESSLIILMNTDNVPDSFKQK